MDVGIQEAEWLKTANLEQRLLGNPLYEEPDAESPHGRFAGRPIIARDTPINEGVYLGSGEREAIVVDDQKYPKELNSVYKEVLKRQQRLMKKTKGSFKEGVLTTVFDFVRKKLRYNPQEVEDLVFKLTGSRAGKDRKVTLNHLIRAEVGICRHQALLAAYLLERLKNEGYVAGNVSVDRNSIPGLGGHAWVRYQNSKDVVFVIDPAQNYVGRLDEAPKQGWSYKRPEE